MVVLNIIEIILFILNNVRLILWGLNYFNLFLLIKIWLLTNKTWFLYIYINLIWPNILYYRFHFLIFYKFLVWIILRFCLMSSFSFNILFIFKFFSHVSKYWHCIKKWRRFFSNFDWSFLKRSFLMMIIFFELFFALLKQCIIFFFLTNCWNNLEICCRNLLEDLVAKDWWTWFLFFHFLIYIWILNLLLLLLNLLLEVIIFTKNRCWFPFL